MGLETVSSGANAAKIGELVKENPTASDAVNRGDDHIRNIKKVIKDTFSGINGEGDDAVTVTATSSELNILDGVTATTEEINKLAGVTATTEDINKLDGLSASQEELNYVDGVTSNIQTQIDGKQDPVSAGNGVVLDGDTINTFGCPYAVVIHDKGEGGGYSINNETINALVERIIHAESSEVTENNNTVYLPAGTYYFEGMAHVYNPSGDDTNGDIRVGLYTDGGQLKGYEGVGYLGERDGREFTCMGKFTTSGDRFRLRIRAGSPTVYYGRQGDGGIASYIKFWKIV